MSGSLPSVYEYGDDIANAAPPSPLPEGEYRATVQAIEARNSKSSGKPMALVTYLISPDQYPADFTEGNADGETMQFYRPLEDTPRNRYLLKKFCEVHGVTPARRINLPDFIGQEVIVSVTHEEYQGEPRARVQPVRAA
jgi:hypothetical protein